MKNKSRNVYLEDLNMKDKNQKLEDYLTQPSLHTLKIRNCNIPKIDINWKMSNLENFSVTNSRLSNLDKMLK